jgi:RNA polymerase sigma-70 factor, ECF subfamily
VDRRGIFSGGKEPIVLSQKDAAGGAHEERARQEDARLAAAAARADPAAMRALVTRLMGRVDHVAKALFKNPASAADASQSAMVEILRSIGSYRPLGSLESWADRITARVGYRMLRGQRRSARREDAETEVESVPEVPSGPRLAEDVPRPVWSYLDRLPEVMHEVLVLRHVLGYSIEEIAELTEVSPNTVKDRLLRGREQVSKLIRRDQFIGVRRGEVG